MAPKNQRRSNRTEIQTNDLERAEIKARAKAFGLPLATYLRFAALGVEIPHKRTAIEAEAVAALNRVGSNLNQIARFANQSGTLTGQQVKALAALHGQIRQTAARINKAVT